jgi:hypothetical protein
MGIFRGPNIVRDGLVLNLDAKNSKSYGGSGNTWTDLSGNGYNATKQGNATWNSNGWWEFRNVNADNDFEYFNLSMDEGILKSANTTGAWSLETWWRDMGTAYGNENIIVGRLGHHAGILQKTNGSAVYGQVRTNAGGTGQISTSTISTTDDAWMHVVFAYNNRTSKLYINGSLEETDTMSTSYTIYGHNNTMNIGGYGHNYYRTYSDIAVVKAYNRELNASDVLQNYNALKSRFYL